MTDTLEKRLNEVALTFRDLSAEGECTDETRDLLAGNPEQAYECTKCKTINAYQLSPHMMSCNNCGEHYDSPILKEDDF